MKYTPPPGESAGAPYVDGNLSAGIEGSEVPAAAIEHPMRELDHLIDFYGLTPNPEDLEQVRKAIQAAIAAATGGGDTDDYILISQARARLPIFPEALTADGKINVASPGAGSILVPPTVNFQHRGIFPLSTSDYSEPDRTFTTLANKTYHLRWNPVDGFALKDVADAGYNPTSAAEKSAIFDSTYDDMLVSRVVTNSSNVATITNLINKNILDFGIENDVDLAHSVLDQTLADSAVELNWSRTPKQPSLAIQYIQAHTELASDNIGHDLRKFGFRSMVFDRYGIADLKFRYQDSDGSAGYVIYTLSGRA